MSKPLVDSFKKIWMGANNHQFNNDRNVGEIILQSLANRNGENVMQIDGDTGESLTRAEAHRQTIRFAQNLQKIGCMPDHPIVVIARNHHKLTPLIFAAICIGTPICPLDVFQDGKSDLIQRIEPTLIFCDTDIAASIQNIIADIGLKAQIFTVNGNVDGFDSIDRLMHSTGNEDNFVPGGSSVPASIVQQFTTMLPHADLITGYGATETCGELSLAFTADLLEYPNATGRLKPHVQIKIVNVVTGMECGIGEEGEIYAKLPIPFMGYFRDAEANRTAFDCDGYFITGDIGYFDDSGQLFISGRKKEMFKVRHYVVWPSQLDDILQGHEAIRKACVVGVFDITTATELAAAVIERNYGHNITEQEVYKLISDKLPEYKWLDGGIYFVDELPETPSGKVMRIKVKEMAENFYKLKQQRN